MDAATYYAQYDAYLKALRGSYTKLAKLDFLYPDGTVSFTLDNKASRSQAFLQSGSLSVNFQNGTRRTADVTLANADGIYDYNVNGLWFGQQVRLSEGLILPDGTEFYIPQGVFYIKNPDEVFNPGERTVTMHLTDKWAYLDGTLFGNLDGIYEIPVGSGIFQAMSSILAMDRGNGYAVDDVAPVYTTYYDGKTQTLPSGATASLLNTPYTLRVDSESGTYADVILGLNDMLVGCIGYDANGRLRVEPSQDDISDMQKEVLYRFSPEETQLLGAAYTVMNDQVYNDIIVLGETQDNYAQPKGRAQNTNPQSDLSIYGALGLRTLRMSAAGYATDRQCQDLADWQLKRNCVLKKSVSVQCGQIFHIQENKVITLRRTDKPGAPEERHLVMGFTRPIGQTGSMTVQAVSANDIATS